MRRSYIVAQTAIAANTAIHSDGDFGTAAEEQTALAEEELVEDEDEDEDDVEEGWETAAGGDVLELESSTAGGEADGEGDLVTEDGLDAEMMRAVDLARARSQQKAGAPLGKQPAVVSS